MIRTITSTAISTALSLCLLIGSYTAATFGFYVLVFFNAFAWVGIFAGVIKGEAAARIRQYCWISALSSAFQIYALIATDHPFLAASCFITSFFIVDLAFGDKEKTPCAD
ncbi:hypothetical protein [Pseudomonas abietaniphila]|uniref:Uncharacterized protein n=1 Tax=Pseudomonas abietaniphila TaxID=89065 RepID=A0A1G8KCM7_9PSED|nr:hypothetical protein [Pseudomonas abietaniphila]SDI41172.1 hypothetical protein SAMN05216605_11351 [Pseudomonas abietaniphila]